MRTRAKRALALGALLLGAGTLAGGLAFRARVAPMPPGRRFYVRYETPRPLPEVLATLQAKGVIRDANATGLALRLLGAPPVLRRGTYAFAPGDGPGTLARTARAPMRRMLRLYRMRWIARTGLRLQRESVCPQADYARAASDAALYRPAFPFVPESGSLEGYLPADTYDLPPLLPPRQVVAMQLQNFGKTVAPLLKGDPDPNRTLTLASLVEMEASRPDDRRKIAGVIENRIRRGMRLQIDATVNYGRGKWGRLYYKDYTGVKSPYNTYLVPGLPPGPICTPSPDAVRAALAPARHDDVYYVALPDGTTLYAPDYKSHLKNVALRRKLVREREAARAANGAGEGRAG